MLWKQNKQKGKNIGIFILLLGLWDKLLFFNI